MRVAKKQFIEFRNVISFEESGYTYNNGCGWKASTLVAKAEEEGCEPFPLYFSNIDIGFLPYKIIDLYDFITHVKRVDGCDLKYPVIMGENGAILDGWHRIAKAILAGHDHIMAVRLHENPPFDWNGDK